MGQGQAGRLSWRALEPYGAEVAFDFRQPMTAQEGEAFKALVHEHQILVARGQQLSLGQQQAISRWIGPVLTHGRGMEYVSPDDGVLDESALTFHSDLAFAPEPFWALSLHALDVAPNRTSTRFASGRRAYEQLPQQLKSRLAGLRSSAISVELTGERNTPEQLPEDSIHQVRDVVQVHPATGRPHLYVSESHTVELLGLPRAEGDDLLAELFARLYAPENVVEHVWADGDFLIWDNLVLQHGRPDLAGVWPRRLQRTAVAERSAAEQMPDYFDRIAAERAAKTMA